MKLNVIQKSRISDQMCDVSFWPDLETEVVSEEEKDNSTMPFPRAFPLNYSIRVCGIQHRVARYPRQGGTSGNPVWRMRHGCSTVFEASSSQTSSVVQSSVSPSRSTVRLSRSKLRQSRSRRHRFKTDAYVRASNPLNGVLNSVIPPFLARVQRMAILLRD